MAIDTREKRQSAASVGMLPVPPTPTPNASKDQEWRQEAGWGYSGILAGEAVVIATSYPKLPMAKMAAMRNPMRGR